MYLACISQVIEAIYRRCVASEVLASIVDPNNRHGLSACRRTGMLPLHVAVANGLRDMYDFLISLPNMDECLPRALHEPSVNLPCRYDFLISLPNMDECRELRCDRLVPSA